MSAAILDVDGTLVDTNYHHALAWWRAFGEHGVELPVWSVHRVVGMGGDRLVAELAGAEVERERGDAIRESEADHYKAMVSEVRPLAGARELIAELKRRRHAVVLASSAKQWEVDHYLDLLDVREEVDGWTTSADVEETKPASDLVGAAMRQAGELSAVMVGDTPWDVRAAFEAEVKTIGVLTGGFSDAELREAGAVDVFASLPELTAGLDHTPLA
jgi:phosphoglycolate phosphatase-like HAD superfamily hydrolase